MAEHGPEHGPEHGRGEVVVGYDGSKGATAAVEWAAVEAYRRRAALTVVHAVRHAVVPTELVAADLEATQAAGSAAERVAHDGAVIAGRAAPALDVRAVAAVGHPVRLLVDLSVPADLVVVGTRGHGALLGALLGSVAFAVTAHAHGPVVVVRGDGTPPLGPSVPVVVGVDGSPASTAALRHAADLAAAVEAPLTVLSAWDVEPAASYAEAYWVSTRPALDERAVARQYAEQVAALAVAQVHREHAGLRVEPDVVQGGAAHALVDASRNAGMVVVGARGRGGFAGLLLGSTSHGVLHAAACPVTVLRG